MGNMCKCFLRERCLERIFQSQVFAPIVFSQESPEKHAEEIAIAPTLLYLIPSHRATVLADRIYRNPSLNHLTTDHEERPD